MSVDQLRRPLLERRAALLALLLLAAPHLAAQTEEIQVYDAEIAAQGSFNLTWHNNYTFDGRSQAAFPGGIVPDHALNGVPEWAYGITKWLEAGLYLPVYTLTRDGALMFDSTKLRALFVVPDAHDRTLFYGVNLELSYNSAHWEPRRVSGEIRPIAGVHLGRLDLIVNPILDTDFNGSGRLEFAPAARAAWNLSPRLALALEEYADFGPVQHFYSREVQSHTLFAVLDLGTSHSGIELGVGRGLTAASDRGLVKLVWMHDL